jgi:hypothetical protein
LKTLCILLERFHSDISKGYQTEDQEGSFDDKSTSETSRGTFFSNNCYSILLKNMTVLITSMLEKKFSRSLYFCLLEDREIEFRTTLLHSYENDGTTLSQRL